MKTKICHHRKRLPAFLKTLTVAALLGMGLTAKAQTGTYTILQQPCNNDGQISVTITSGMTPPLDFYYYDMGGTYHTHSNVNSLTDILTGVGAPIVYIQVSPSSGGSSFSTGVTGMNQPFTVDPISATNAVCPALTGTAQVTINGGAAPASVQWYSYPTGSYAGTGNPMVLAPGMYSTIVTNAGCVVGTGTDSLGVVYIDNVSGISFTVPTTMASCTNGTASVSGLTGGTAPYTYLWSNGATSSSLSGLMQGSYNVTVTDAQGCNSTMTGFVYQSITINANPVVTNATCLQNDGAVISFGSGGTPPYSYAYSNGMTGQSISGIAGGTALSVTVTDAAGCIGTSYSYVNSTTPVNVTYTATPSSCTAPTGTAALSVSGGTAPYSIAWNTSPAMSGTGISSMPSGNYSFTVMDAVGCVRTGTAVIPSVSTLTTFPYVTNPVCPATTGNIGVNASGTNPPFSYLWSTGATTPGVTGVGLGSYSCVITDNLGCTQTRNAYVTAISPISVGLSSTTASCMYTADGSVLANAVGGTAPYSYTWSNGQTGPNATALATGNYYVSVQDANGCHQSSHTSVGYNALTDNCYCTITGKVYADANSNCTQDPGEPGIEHIQIHCAGFGYAFTDANGDYSFRVPTGSYTLSESVQYMYPLATCQSNSIPVNVTAASGCSTTVNFANNVNTIHDMHVLRTSTQAVPGNPHRQELIVTNEGTVTETGIQLGHRTDGQLNFVSTSPVSYSQLNPGTEPNWYSVTSGLSMTAGQSTMIYFDYSVATNIPIGTSVLFSDSTSNAAPMSNWLNDYTPWNNVDTYTVTVVGSYDPNFKEVSPAGTGPQGFIATSDSVLDYVVHFQNSGTYYAEKVVVMDTLDADLEWTSVRPGFADHAYTVTLSENGVLTFTFDHIHLPWQAMTEMGSRGLFTYSVKQKPNLAPGTQIKNSAAIYFDYNAPVITNQTVNTIQIPSGISENETASDLSIYPNPANDVLNVNLSNAENVNMILIYDLQGRLVQSEKTVKNSGTQKVTVAGLVKGLYFVVLEKADGQKVTGKFIKN